MEQKEDSKEEKKETSRWKAVGINLAVLVAYTLICKFTDGGVFLDAFFIAIHFTAAIITSIVVKKWEWVLSAFLVLAIGFSTCVSFLDMPNMH
jgi:hypothetical protein